MATPSSPLMPIKTESFPSLIDMTNSLDFEVSIIHGNSQESEETVIIGNPQENASRTPPGAPKQEPREFQVPTSKSFAFSISDLWHPAKQSLLSWVNDLPGPARRQEQTFEPAHYHALKHNLDHHNVDDGNDGPTGDDHRRKRAKVCSPTGIQLPSRRRKLVKSSRGLVRKVSSAYQRVVTPSQHGSLSKNSKRESFPSSRADTPAPEPTPSPGTPTFALIERPKMRFVFVGDAACGKSSMLLRYYNDSFTLHYKPTKYELFSKAIIVNNEAMDLELWDTSGDIEKEQLSRLNYLAWDAVFLCFDVASMRSFHSARSQWLAQVRRHCPDVPIIFAALQTDKRVGPGLWAPLYPNLITRVTATEGAMTADIIGARKYVECSAQSGQGINGVLEEGVRAVVERRKKKLEADTDNRVNRQSRLSGLFCMK